MIADIAVLVIVGVLFFLSVRKIVSDYRKGIPSCGMMCEGCASHSCSEGSCSCSTENVPKRFRAKKEDKTSV